MRSRYAVAIALVLAATSLANAWSRQIQWWWDVQDAVNRAQATGLPLLLYVRDGNADESDLERAQERALRDDMVAAYVESRFIPVKLAESNANERLLLRLGVAVPYGNFLVVVTPGGKRIGTIDSTAVAMVPTLVDRLTEMFRRYRHDLFENVLKPQLEEEPFDPAAAAHAIDRIRAFQIMSASDALVQLLDRGDLHDDLRQKIYETLAMLSTEEAVKALAENAGTNKVARLALQNCTPMGAKYMLRWLRGEDGEVRPYVYEAIVHICHVPNARDLLFWRNASPERQQEEIDRVKDIVDHDARVWQERIGQYR